MKKVVPFKKDISFDTNIALVNSISLEHFVNKKSDGLISGNFLISGDYKMSDTSISLDNFEYELPFNINVDKKYNIDEASVDINDFYYEVINNKILSVNIELLIDDIKEVEVESRMSETLGAESKADSTVNSDRCVEDEVVTNDKTKSIFDNLDENESYCVYKVHIVTENDTTESIIQSYGVSRELLADYNDLSDIKLGDKIIVPTNES